MIVSGLALMAVAVGVIWGLREQAKEIRRLREQTQWSKDLTAAIVEDERRKQQGEDRKVIDFLA